MTSNSATYACRECGIHIGDLELMRIHMIHSHGAAANWPEPPLFTVTEDEAEELSRYLAHAYVDPLEYPGLRTLLRRIDQHLSRNALTERAS